jgi:hypothetical protein
MDRELRVARDSDNGTVSPREPAVGSLATGSSNAGSRLTLCRPNARSGVYAACLWEISQQWAAEAR